MLTPASRRQSDALVIQVSKATDVGLVRSNNEDYVKAERIDRDGRPFRVWAVADGVGGGPRGEDASRTAVETVIDYLVKELWTDPVVALTQAFTLANTNVFEITDEGAAASTMVVALMSESDRMLSIANVGDSRAYLINDGAAWQITNDHSIVAARVAAGQITAAEARTAPDRNLLTRGIGSEREVQTDVFGPRQLQPNQRLVLCSDGVHGMLDDTAIGQLASSLPITDSADSLVAAALEAGGKDNATALVGGFESAKGPVKNATTAMTSARRVHWPSRRVALIALRVVLALLVAIVLSSLTGSLHP